MQQDPADFKLLIKEKKVLNKLDFELDEEMLNLKKTISKGTETFVERVRTPIKLKPL
jgi:hypothetical protein